MCLHLYKRTFNPDAELIPGPSEFTFILFLSGVGFLLESFHFRASFFFPSHFFFIFFFLIFLFILLVFVRIQEFSPLFWFHI